MTSPWLSVGERWSGRSGSPFNLDRREYTRIFRVETTDKRLGPIAACVAPGVPLIGSSYIAEDGAEFDAFSLLIDKQATQASSDNDWCVWDVTCKYSTDVPAGGLAANLGSPGGLQDGSSGNQNGALNNPEMELPSVEWDHEVVQVAPAVDRNGDPFVNSALQPFSPAFTHPAAVPVLMITRKERRYNYQTALSYSYALNDKPFLGAPIGSVQCLPPKAKMGHKGPLMFWEVTYKLRFCTPEINDGSMDWQPRILDAGLMEFVKPIKNIILPPLEWFTLKPITRGGHPVSQPMLLDGFGRAQNPVTAPDPQNPAGPPLRKVSPKYVERVVYRYRSFTKLISTGLS